MTEGVRGYDVVVDFWEWCRRREARLNPLASYAFEQCEETFRKCDWHRFGYWHAIYLRERPKMPGSRVKVGTDQN
jgi:hypothetical protein